MLKRATPQRGLTKLTFVIPLDDAPQPVSVVGEFNHWDPAAHPLKKRSNGTRSVTVEVPAGSAYQFKYVTSDGTWFCEPDAEDHVVNEFGALNSVVTA